MSLLSHPEAKAILADAVVNPNAVAGQTDRLRSFLRRYLPKFYRAEQRATAATVIRDRLGGLERKTSEPIAIEAGLRRRRQGKRGHAAPSDRDWTSGRICHRISERGIGGDGTTSSTRR